MSLFEKGKAELEELAKSGLPGTKSEESRVAFRAKMVLEAQKGTAPIEIANTLGTSRQMVEKWTARFDALGIDGLRSRPTGRPRKEVEG